MLWENQTMKVMLILIISFVFAASIAAKAQNFQQRIADIDEKAAELQRRLHENELRLQRHAEIMEEAQLRLKALQAGEELPPRVKIPAAPPEPSSKIKEPPVLPPPTVPSPAPQPSPVPIASGQGEKKPASIPSPRVSIGTSRNYFFQIFSGFVIPENVHLPSENRTTNFDSGYSVGAGAGLDFVNWRLGLELSHRSYDDSQQDFGHAEANALIANIGWNLNYWSSNEFYLGLGVGPSWAKIQRPGSVSPLKDKLVSYQLSTGLGHRFTEKLSGRLGYKYFSTSNASDHDRLTSHAIEAFLDFDL